MEAVDSIELTAHGVVSLVLRDLSEYATLPFLAAFDIQNCLSPSNTLLHRSTTHPRSRERVLSRSREIDAGAKVKRHSTQVSQSPF